MISTILVPNLLVLQIYVKIALNVAYAWNLVQMKLLRRRSKTELGAFGEFSPFVCVPIWLLQTKHRNSTKGKKIQENYLLAFKKTEVTLEKNSEN